MKVKDVIASALTLIGRTELIPYIEDPSNAGGDDAGDVIETLLYCFNAVEDELAHKYIPLVAREELLSPDTRFFYSTFTHNPVKIRRVTVDGKTVPFEVFSRYMVADAKNIVVEYEYAPTRKLINMVSDYGDEVGEYLIALGIAAEYCIINGEAEMSERWEKKYRIRLDRIQRTLPVCASIPPRRWI